MKSESFYAIVTPLDIERYERVKGDFFRACPSTDEANRGDVSLRLFHRTLLPLLLMAAALLCACGGGERAETEHGEALAVTELMVSSSVSVTGRDGGPCQWVELRNTGDAPLSLGGCALVCGEQRAALPERTVAPGEYVLVTSDDWDGLTLPERGTLCLYRGETLLSAADYHNRTPECSYLVSEGIESGQPTPGYETVREADALIISEVMSNNDHCAVDGMLCDWVELYNAGTEPVELGEYYLSKRPDRPYECRLPEQVLESGGYAVLRCGSELSFNISKAGAELYLTRRDGVGAYALAIPALESDETFTCDRGVAADPTPGAPNVD